MFCSGNSFCDMSLKCWLIRGSDGGRTLSGIGGEWSFSGASSNVLRESDEPNTDEPSPLVDEPKMLPLEELNRV